MNTDPDIIRRRRTRFLEVLREAEAQQRRFNMRKWIQLDSDCGTICCAVGFAMLDNEMAALGLGGAIDGVTHEGGENLQRQIDAMIARGTYAPSIFPYPRYEGRIDCGGLFFGVPEYDFDNCILSNGYFSTGDGVTLAQVIDRLETTFAKYPI